AAVCRPYDGLLQRFVLSPLAHVRRIRATLCRSCDAPAALCSIAGGTRPEEKTAGARPAGDIIVRAPFVARGTGCYSALVLKPARRRVSIKRHGLGEKAILAPARSTSRAADLNKGRGTTGCTAA